MIGAGGPVPTVEPFVFETRLRGKVIDPSASLSWDDRLTMGREEVATILRKIWPYVLLGVGLGAVIHGWVPADWFAAHASSRWWGVPIAVGIGVALYSNAAGVLPLVEALHSNGLPIGTVLAFMMGVVALSLPEMIREAVTALGLDARFEKVTDPVEIESWEVMATPALVVDDEVVVSGRVPSTDDIGALLATR